MTLHSMSHPLSRDIAWGLGAANTCCLHAQGELMMTARLTVGKLENTEGLVGEAKGEHGPAGNARRTCM